MKKRCPSWLIKMGRLRKRTMLVFLYGKYPQGGNSCKENVWQASGYTTSCLSRSVKNVCIDFENNWNLYFPCLSRVPCLLGMAILKGDCSLRMLKGNDAFKVETWTGKCCPVFYDTDCKYREADRHDYGCVCPYIPSF